MIQSKQELIQLLDPLYHHFDLPLFLLSQDLMIIDSSQSFLKLEDDY